MNRASLQGVKVHHWRLNVCASLQHPTCSSYLFCTIKLFSLVENLNETPKLHNEEKLACEKIV